MKLPGEAKYAYCKQLTVPAQASSTGEERDLVLFHQDIITMPFSGWQ